MDFDRATNRLEVIRTCIRIKMKDRRVLKSFVMTILQLTIAISPLYEDFWYQKST